jgi:hypothetical protein
MEIVYMMLVVAAGLGLWQAISPQSSWEALESWRYQDPRMHRPSESGFSARRVGGALAVVAAVCLGLGLHMQMSEAQEAQDRQRERDNSYQECLRNQSGDGLLSPSQICSVHRP